MTSPTAQGVFLNTSENFQVNEDELRYLLTKQTYQTASAVNLKETAIYQTVEIQTSQTWFNPSNVQNPRYGFRTVYSFNAIAAGATLVIPHGLQSVTLYTKIYGTCITDVVDYRPIPYSSDLVNTQIEINVDATNINITNGLLAPNITSGIVVLEYLKN